jgi:hypothetical protein
MIAKLKTLPDRGGQRYQPDPPGVSKKKKEKKKKKKICW